ncbi:MAG TPA: type II toxin-antitoxin system CcdA family antitoxin [Nocardioidaceae bacterium]|nr:type II toxin-antitoxin system CcdA family antitoxin [Nocardioidaceae bacterium]
MAKTRISTTVDSDLLNEARALLATNDASLVEQALAALVAQHREAAIDASYAAYDEIPMNTPDEWGDLESWRIAAARS